MTGNQWADKLEQIAAAIAETVYSHEFEMSKYHRERKVRWDDADHLRNLAKELRGEDGQLAHTLNRQSLPWRGTDEAALGVNGEDDSPGRRRRGRQDPLDAADHKEVRGAAD